MDSNHARAVLTYIAANVRAQRIRRGMTQEGLAEAAYIHLRFLQDVETAKANPSVIVLVAIADALGVLPGELFHPAEMSEIKRGRPPRPPSAAMGTLAQRAPLATPGKVSRKVAEKADRKLPGKVARKSPGK